MIALARRMATAAAVAVLAVSSAAAQAPEPALHPRILTRDEVRSSAAGDVMGAVRALRPDWLNERVTAVYLDETNLGGAEALAGLPVADVRYLRYLPRAASSRIFKPNPKGAVIQVVTDAGPAELTAEGDARTFAIPTWGVGPQVSVFAGRSHLLGSQEEVLGRYDDGWMGGAALSYPVAPAFSVRVAGGRRHMPGAQSQSGDLDITDLEATLKGVWGRSSVIHPYLLVGVTQQWVSGNDENVADSGTGYTFGGGLEVKLGGSLIAFAESGWSNAISGDKSLASRPIRAGLSWEFQREKFARPR